MTHLADDTSGTFLVRVFVWGTFHSSGRKQKVGQPQSEQSQLLYPSHSRSVCGSRVATLD